MVYTAHHIRQLIVAKEIFIRHPDGVTDVELALLVRCSRTTAYRYRRELTTYEVSPGRWSMRPSAEDILLAHTVLARLAHDTANPHKPREAQRRHEDAAD